MSRAVTVIAGTERFYYDMSVMLGYRPCAWWGICWRFITPALIAVNLLLLSVAVSFYIQYVCWSFRYIIQLHWLPVRQRVLFKIAVLVFQCLAGQALSYLSDNCQPVSDSRPHRLRSSDSLTCVVRRAHNVW